MELVLFTYQNLINASPLLAHAFRTSVPFLVGLCSLFYEDIVLKDDIIVEEVGIVTSMCPKCSLNVPCLLPECSLNVPL
jgi:hypothetical protein